jgi:hypothetical protein
MTGCIDRLRHYGTKCEHHLARVRLSHALAIAGLKAESSLTSDLDELIAKARGNSAEPLREKLGKFLHEVHLIALKANFELFLNRSMTTLLRCHISLFVKHLEKKKLSLRDVASTTLAGGSEPIEDFIIDQLVPPHGLEEFVKAFVLYTKIDLVSAVDRVHDRAWPQIKTAFEIRHLIEHRDGKVDAAFRRKVQGVWRSSTWSLTQLQDLNVVEVTERDMAATYEAMQSATRAITDNLVNWSGAKGRT